MPANAEAVYTILAQVPFGQVITYGALAKAAGYPGAARWAGSLMRQLPADSKLPWHRVINASGRLSLPGQAGATQRMRLEAEGVLFKNSRIDLKRYHWPPR